MVKLKNIALKAGVSTATVSHVLNDTGRVGAETRKKVLEIVEELNYKPNRIAKSLKLKRTKTIGVIAEDVTVFHTPQIIDGINEFAESHDYSILFINLRLFKKIGNDFSQTEAITKLISPAINQLVENQVEGIIYIGTHTRDITGIVPSLSIPIVYTYCYTTNEKEYSINYNDEKAAFELTNYLVEAGHSKVALISGLIDSQQSHDRFNGYRRALAEKGIALDFSFVKTGNWELESGYELSMNLLTQENRPTGIVALNDLMAAGALQAARELNIKVPQELSIVGFDNREFSNFTTPPLTTMAIPLHEMGEKAMEFIYTIINRKNNQQDAALEQTLQLSCQLIERQSVNGK